MRVLVCGGRKCHDKARVFAVLDKLSSEAPFTCVIHGGARGADTLAALWAADVEVSESVFMAEWLHGKAAGPIRNQRMLDEGKPDLVIAFPGGRGTADMVRRARKAGVRVVEVEDDG